MKKIIYIPFIVIIIFVVGHNTSKSNGLKKNIKNKYVLESFDSNTYYALRQEKDID